MRQLGDIEQRLIGTMHEECLELRALRGAVIIDEDNFQRIMGIEILNRPDNGLVLKQGFPGPGAD